MNKIVRFETLGPLDLIGTPIYANPDKVPFHLAWELFGKIADDASISRTGKDLYGLQIYPPWFREKHEIIYMACIEKQTNTETPIRMLSKTLPKCKYVVQTVDGGINGIDQTLKNLYEDFIPNNGLKIAMPFDFEKYCNIDNHNSFSNHIEIWVPIF
jgi:predicted transcriptional regulator YdeE